MDKWRGGNSKILRTFEKICSALHLSSRLALERKLPPPAHNLKHRLGRRNAVLESLCEYCARLVVQGSRRASALLYGADFFLRQFLLSPLLARIFSCRMVIDAERLRDCVGCLALCGAAGDLLAQFDAKLWPTDPDAVCLSSRHPSLGSLADFLRLDFR